MNKKILKYIGLFIAICLLGFWLSQTNWSEVLKYQKAVGFNFFYFVLVIFIAQVLATIAWGLCFNEFPRHVPLYKLFLMRHVGETLAVINPTSVVAGESLKAFLMKRENVALKDTVVSLTISRFLIIFSFTTLAILSVSIYLGQSEIKGKYFFISSIIFIFIILLFIFRWYLKKGRGILADIFNFIFYFFNKKKWFFKTLEKLKELDSELLLVYNQNNYKLFWAFVLSWIHWIFGSLEFFLILKFMGHDISIFSAIFIESGVMLFKSIFAFVPAQIGFEESGNKVMLSLIGLPGNEIWVAVSALRRARQALWLVIGFVFYRIFFMKDKNLLEQGS